MLRRKTRRQIEVALALGVLVLALQVVALALGAPVLALQVVALALGAPVLGLQLELQPLQIEGLLPEG